MSEDQSTDRQPFGRRAISAVKVGLATWLAVIVGLSIFGAIIGVPDGIGYIAFMMMEGAMFGFVLGWPIGIVGALAKFFMWRISGASP